MTDLDRALTEWRRCLAAEQRYVLSEISRQIRAARSRADSGASEAVVAWEAALALLEAAL